MTTSNPLRILYEEIAARAAAISSSTPDWPCRRGCDHCCRHLACLPELVPDEWSQIEAGLAGLPPEPRAAIEDRLAALQTGARPPFTCPFLDPDNGACHIYSHRPAACRTYGFYVLRDAGSYCGIIRERVESGACSSVVWGNHEAVDTRLDQLGPKIPIREWLQRRAAIR